MPCVLKSCYMFLNKELLRKASEKLEINDHTKQSRGGFKAERQGAWV